MSISSDTTAGTNATATQYNDLRTDTITQLRRFFFEIKGTLVTGDGLQVIPLPVDMTITKIKHRVVSGSATLRIRNATTGDVIKSNISIGTSYGNETTGLANTTASEGDEISVDLTGVSSADTLRVLVYATEII